MDKSVESFQAIMQIFKNHGLKGSDYSMFKLMVSDKYGCFVVGVNKDELEFILENSCEFCGGEVGLRFGLTFNTVKSAEDAFDDTGIEQAELVLEHALTSAGSEMTVTSNVFISDDAITE